MRINILDERVVVVIEIALNCLNCGNKIELRSNQQGEQIQMSRLRDKNFVFQSIDIENNGELNDYEDISDVETELTNIRIDCRKCNDSYVVLEDFQLE